VLGFGLRCGGGQLSQLDDRTSGRGPGFGLPVHLAAVAVGLQAEVLVRGTVGADLLDVNALQFVLAMCCGMGRGGFRAGSMGINQGI